MILLFTISSQSQAVNKQKIIINDVDWPPYFLIEGESSLKGIGKEILNNCLTINNYRPDFVKLPIKRTHYFMKQGDIDLTVYSYKQEREAFLYYSKEALFKTDYGFMVRANSNLVIESLEDLTPLRVGHLAGLSYTPELLKIINDKLEKEEAVIANSIHSVYSQLLADIPRIDITANTKSTFFWQANILGVRDKIKVLDYTIKTKAYFMTVSKQSKNISDPNSFINQIDECVKAMKISGDYQKILNRYQNLQSQY